MGRTYRVFTYKIHKLKALFLLLIILFSIPILTLNLNKCLKVNDKIGITIKNLTQKLGVGLVKFLLGFDINNPETIIFSECPIFSYVKSSLLLANKNEEDLEVNQNKSEFKNLNSRLKPIKTCDLSKNKQKNGNEILLENKTSIDVDPKKLLQTSLDPPISRSDKILLLHTHSSQSYSPAEKKFYTSQSEYFGADENLSVLVIGKEITNIFKKNGISIIHDSTDHECQNNQDPYASSAKTFEKQKNENLVNFVLDIERDLIIKKDTMIKAIANIKGESYAQCVFIIGTDDCGLPHPNWEDNLKLAIKLQNSIESEYPGLMRPIKLVKERLNQHQCRSLLLKIGTSANTAEEALKSAEVIAKNIAEFLNQEQ